MGLIERDRGDFNVTVAPCPEYPKEFLLSSTTWTIKVKGYAKIMGDPFVCNDMTLVPSQSSSGLSQEVTTVEGINIQIEEVCSQGIPVAEDLLLNEYAESAVTISLLILVRQAKRNC